MSFSGSQSTTITGHQKKCIFRESDFFIADVGLSAKSKFRVPAKLKSQMKAQLAEVEPHKLGVLSSSLSSKEKLEIRQMLPKDQQIQFFVQTNNKLITGDVGRFPTYVIERQPNTKLDLEKSIAKQTANVARLAAKKRNTEEYKRAVSKMVAAEISSFEHRKQQAEVANTHVLSSPRLPKWSKQDGDKLLDLLPSKVASQLLVGPRPPNHAVSMILLSTRAKQLEEAEELSEVISVATTGSGSVDSEDGTHEDGHGTTGGVEGEVMKLSEGRTTTMINMGEFGEAQSPPVEDSEVAAVELDMLEAEKSGEGLLAKWKRRANKEAGVKQKTGTWEEDHLILQQLLCLQRLRSFCTNFGFKAEHGKEIYDILANSEIDERSPLGGFGCISSKTFVKTLSDIPFPVPTTTTGLGSGSSLYGTPATAAAGGGGSVSHGGGVGQRGRRGSVQGGGGTLNKTNSEAPLPSSRVSFVPVPPTSSWNSRPQPQSIPDTTGQPPKLGSKRKSSKRKVHSPPFPVLHRQSLRPTWELLFRIFDPENIGFCPLQNILLGIEWVAKDQNPLYLVIACLSPVCTNLSVIHTAEYQVMLTHLTQDVHNYIMRKLTPNFTPIPPSSVPGKDKIPVIMQRGRAMPIAPYQPRKQSILNQQTIKEEMEEDKQFLMTLEHEMSNISSYFNNCIKVEFLQFLKAITISDYLREHLQPFLAEAYETRKCQLFKQKTEKSKTKKRPPLKRVKAATPEVHVEISSPVTQGTHVVNM